MKKTLLFFYAISCFFVACVQRDLRLPFSSLGRATSKININSVAVKSNQLIIQGSGFLQITNVAIKNNSMAFSESFIIESKSDSIIIANGLRNLSVVSNVFFDLILSSAQASSTFAINFTVANGSITAAMLGPMNATKGQVMKYNGAAWVPSSITNAQTYLGTWDAAGNAPDLTLPSSNPGDYYIIAVAGTFNSIPYSVGDWIISDGYNWQKVANSAVVVSTFKGRRGIVIPTKDDYNIGQMADVDLTTTLPVANNVLTYDATLTKWTAKALPPGNSGTVTNVTGNSPISIASNSSTPVVSISQSNATTNGFLSSTDWNTFNNKQANIASTTGIPEGVNYYFTDARVRSAALTGIDTTQTGAIIATDSILAAIGKAQGQIALKANTSSLVDWSSAGTPLIHPTRIYSSPTQSSKTLVTDSMGSITTSPVTPTELGYISGVTSSIQTQLNNLSNGTGLNQWTANGSNIYRASGNVGIGTTAPVATLDVRGTLLLSNSTSSYLGIKAASSSGTTIYTFPTSQGSAGQVLTTDGLLSTPTLSWVSPITSTSTIATSQLAGPNDTTKYLRGDKTWSTLATDALASVLSSFTVDTNLKPSLTTADTITSAFGKVQKYINDLNGDYVSKSGSNTVTGTFNLTGITAFLNIPTPTGTTLTEAANVQYVKAYADTKISNSGGVSTTDLTINGITVGTGTGNINTNLAVGAGVLFANTTGAYNTAIGQSALYNNTTGTLNTASGHNALYSNTTGKTNTAIGESALYSNKANSESTAIGYGSMYNANNTTTEVATQNTALGAYSLYGSASPAANTGTQNTAVGHSALRNMVNGAGNIGVGYYAGTAITNGTNNIIIGSGSGTQITTGYSNLIIGANAGTVIQSGHGNVIIGGNANALPAGSVNNILLADGAGTERMRVDSSGNIGIGTTTPGALMEISNSGTPSTGNSAFMVTGSANAGAGIELNPTEPTAHRYTLLATNSGSSIGIGKFGIYDNFTGGGYRFIIDNSGKIGIGTTNPGTLLHVSTGALAATVATFQSGNGSCAITPITGMVCTSDARLKENILEIPNALSKMLSLRGVSFQWKERALGDNGRSIGFIAQEIEKVAPELVREASNGYKQVNYANFVAVITQGVKEFYHYWYKDSQSLHREIASLKESERNKDQEIIELKNRIEKIEQAIANKKPLLQKSNGSNKN